MLRQGTAKLTIVVEDNGWGVLKMRKLASDQGSSGCLWSNRVEA